MHNLSRRKFLGWTSAGAVGAGLLTLVPRLATRSTEPDLAVEASRPATALAGGFSAEPIVAYAQNPASGQLSIMAGTSEIVIHDPDLVARLRQLLAR